LPISNNQTELKLMKTIKPCLFVLAFFFMNSALADTVKIRKVEGEKEQLVMNILKLALSKVNESIILNQSSENYSEARLINEIESGNVDVMWSGASPENEDRLLTVRIPILKGLLGHRIFLIRKKDQNKFSDINDLQDLKELKAGQGTFWGDTKVLKNAAIPTVTTIKYNNLFLMLDGERFDYFPRAVHEPWVEVENRPELNISVEKNIMLVYPMALYFYVHKQNRELHDQIYQGFDMAIKDGSFDRLFFDHPMIKDVLDKAELEKRLIIRIDNPFMHSETPTDVPEYWLDIKSL